MKKFEWSDELVLKFADFTNKESSAFQGRYADLHEFKRKHGLSSYNGISGLIDAIKKKHEPKPDFEVVEMRHGFAGVTSVFDKAMESVYGTREEWVKHFIDAICGWKIGKVKRLSDGEVFAIGDKITQQYWNGQIRDITGFNEFDWDGYGLMATTSPGSVRVNIKSETVKKVPARVKLFTTADGKDVFEGDRIVVLSTDSWSVFTGIQTSSRPFPGDKGQFLYFSTEQAAKNYILENKPCLSINQVLQQYDLMVKGHFYPDRDFRKILIWHLNNKKS